MSTRLKNIVWDWNGTLLDDLSICLKGINILLERRKLPLLSEERYREIFTFPIRNYYEAAGFNFGQEPFEIPAEEFIVEYKQIMQHTRLFPDVASTLARLNNIGIRQFVLSAMEQQALRSLIKQHGIDHFFDEVCGIYDNYAVSKTGRGKQMMDRHGLHPPDTLLVGDTLHDVEVAAELGMQVLLIGRGHQHPDRLKVAGKPILNELNGFIHYILNGH